MHSPYLPFLSSRVHSQASVLARHALEHGLHDNAADEAMLRDDIQNMRLTLDKIEQELDMERNTHKRGEIIEHI